MNLKMSSTRFHSTRQTNKYPLILTPSSTFWRRRERRGRGVRERGRGRRERGMKGRDGKRGRDRKRRRDGGGSRRKRGSGRESG